MAAACPELFRPGAGDGPVPLPLVHAMIEVLRDWQPRPDAIVVVESTTRARLTRDLADGLSRHLGVPITAQVAVVDPDVPPGRGSANSAQRLAAVHRRYALVGDVPGVRVLLVDDLMVTGWTLAWSAELLRRAGAEAVLPLTLAVEA